MHSVQLLMVTASNFNKMKYYQRAILKMFVNSVFVSGTIGVKFIIEIDSKTKRYETKKISRKKRRKAKLKSVRKCSNFTIWLKVSSFEGARNQMDKSNGEALG